MSLVETATEVSDLELRTLQSVHGSQDQREEGTRREQTLPRADGGKDAWLFLLGCFMIEFLVWGKLAAYYYKGFVTQSGYPWHWYSYLWTCRFPFSFGIFEEYYTTHPPFNRDNSGVAAIGTTSTGVMYLGSPLILLLLQRYPRSRRVISITGFLIAAVALAACSFSTAVFHLILTQGVLYGVGGSLLYSPIILYLDEWFVQRKGLAFGIMWAGTGLAGLVLPFVMAWGLTTFGFRAIIRAWTITFVLLTGPFIYYVKPRLPVPRTSGPSHISFAFIGTRTFWVLQTGNIIQGLGYFIPSVYLPSYANSSGYSHVIGTILVSLINSTSIIGVVLMGFLVDHLHVTTVILISSLGATASVLLIWGLASSTPVLCLFSLLYGIFAGGFTASWTGVIKEVKRRSPEAEAGTVLGLFAAGRGIGAVASGPLSSKLLESGALGPGVGGYGTNFAVLIIFTGLTAFFGGISWLGRRARII